MIKKILMYSAVPGMLLALVGLWKAFNFDTPAWSSNIIELKRQHDGDLKTLNNKYAVDLKSLNRQQSIDAVELYQSKVRGIILTPIPTNPANAAIYHEELAKARRQQQKAEDRLLELNK